MRPALFNPPGIISCDYQLINPMQKILIIVILILGCFCIVAYTLASIASLDTLNSPFSTIKGFTIEEEFFVFFPGIYTLQLTADMTIAEADEEVELLFGKFGCVTDDKHPCGSYKKFEIQWEFRQSSQVIDRGVASHMTESNSTLSKNRWGRALGTVHLPFGNVELNARMLSSFQELQKFNPHLYLRPGAWTDGIPSNFAAVVLISYILAIDFIVPLIGILFVGLFFLYLKNLYKKYQLN